MGLYANIAYRFPLGSDLGLGSGESGLLLERLFLAGGFVLLEGLVIAGDDVFKKYAVGLLR